MDYSMLIAIEKSKRHIADLHLDPVFQQTELMQGFIISEDSSPTGNSARLLNSSDNVLDKSSKSTQKKAVGEWMS